MTWGNSSSYFLRESLLSLFPCGQFRPTELHHFQPMASKATLITPFLASRKEKDWKSRIIKFLLSMRCGNFTHQFCLYPISESLVTWPLFIARKAEKCSFYCVPATTLLLWRKRTDDGYLAVSATDMLI